MARLNDTIVNGDLATTGSIAEGGSSLVDKYAPKTHTHDYMPISGGTFTGVVNAFGSQYVEGSGSYDLTRCGLNMKNSDIIGCNSIIFEDASDGASEGIQFYNSAGKVNSLWCNAGGTLYFTPDRALGSNSTTGVFSVTKTGAVTANTLAATDYVEAKYFNAKSDKRLKENITQFEAKKSVLDLPVYEYNFIKDENKVKHVGCLAQELQEICPEIVSEGKDGYLSIQENKIVYLLLEEVKKLRQEVDELKKNKD